jgi:hypothetical protein
MVFTEGSEDAWTSDLASFNGVCVRACVVELPLFVQQSATLFKSERKRECRASSFNHLFFIEEESVGHQKRPTLGAKETYYMRSARATEMCSGHRVFYDNSLRLSLKRVSGIEFLII